MDWLGIFSLIVSVLVIPLLRKEVLFFIPDISKCLIKKATRILPSGYYQDRYEEEFLERIEKLKGSFCQLLRAIGCAWACVGILRELRSKFLGDFTYQVNREGIHAEGFFTFKYSFRTNLSASGELKTIVETDGTPRGVSIPWKSTQIEFLDINRMKISYEILDLNSHWIKGHLIGSYNVDTKGFSGSLYRKPKSYYDNYEQLSFKAERTKTK